MRVVVVAAFLLVAFGCEEKAPPKPTPTKVDDLGVKKKPVEKKPVEEKKAAPDPFQEAANIFKARCAVCHGESGKGDGVTAAAMTPKPRDYSDPAWQKSVTDELIVKAIIKGGPAIGKSPLMPANADLEKRPEVVAELVKIIRGFAKK